MKTRIFSLSTLVVFLVTLAAGLLPDWSPPVQAEAPSTAGEAAPGQAAAGAGIRLSSFYRMRFGFDTSLGRHGLHLAAFLPDGHHALWSGRHMTVLVNLDTGAYEQHLFHEQARFAALSPDGTQVLTVYRERNGATDEVWLWDLASATLLRTFHHHAVMVAAFSPDGSQILTAGEDHMARLWNADTGDLLRTLDAASNIYAVAFSPDGSQVLTGSSSPDELIRLWNLSDGTLVRTFNHEHTVSSVAFSPDGSRILSGGYDARLWDAASGDLLQTFTSTGDWPIATAIFSPDGGRILAGGRGETRLWDAASGDLLHTFSEGWFSLFETGKAAFSPDGTLLLNDNQLWEVASGTPLRSLEDVGYVYSTAFSPDGGQILLGGADKAILWDVASGTLLHDFGSEGRGAAAFSPDGGQIVTAYQSEARIWDSATGSLIRSFGVGSGVGSVAFSPDGTLILTGDYYHNAKLWDAATGALVRTFPHDDSIEAVNFSPDGSLLLSSTSSRTYLWEAATGDLLYTFDERGPAVFSPDGRYLLTQSAVWEVSTGRMSRRLSTADNSSVLRFAALAFFPDGSGVLSIGADGIVLWHLSEYGQTLFGFEGGHTGRPQAAAIAPAAMQALMVSGDGSDARLWDITTGELLQVFTEADDVAALSADGALALTGMAYSYDAQLWDTATGAALRPLNGHSRPVSAAAFSPDGSQVLTGDDEGNVYLWEVATGNLLYKVREHTGTINAVAFSPDGSKLLSGGSGVQLWNAADGTLLQEFATPAYGVSAVAFTPSGQVLTGDYESLKLWNPDTGDPLRSFPGARSVSALACSADGSRVAASEDETSSGVGFAAVVWDLDTGEQLGVFGADSGNENWDVAFSEDGSEIIAVGGSHSLVRRWEVATGDLLFGFPYYASIEALAVSPVGSLFLTQGWKGPKLWNTATGAYVREFADESFDTPLAFSSDGTKILTKSQLWDIESGRLLLTLASSEIAAFSPDDRQILTGDDSGAALWDVATGQVIRTFSGCAGYGSHSVAFSPDGSSVLYSSGLTTCLWNPATGELLHTFHQAGGDDVRSIAFSPDASHLIIAGNASVRIYDAQDYHLARLYNSAASRAVFSPDGTLLAMQSGSAVYLWDVWVDKLALVLQASGSITDFGFSSDGKTLFVSERYSWQAWDISTLPGGSRRVTPLTLGTAVEDALSPLRWKDFSLEVPAGQSVLVSLTPLDTLPEVWFYDRMGVLPTLSNFEARVQEPTPRGQYELLLSPAQAGTYYLSLFGKKITPLQGDFRILAQAVERYLSDSTPRQAGNSGLTTLHLTGLGFTEGMQASLQGLNAFEVSFLSPTELTARFDLSGASPGTYDLTLQWPSGESETLPGALTIVPGSGPRLETAVAVPAAHRWLRRSGGNISYTNTGDADAPAALLRLITTPPARMSLNCDSPRSGRLQVLSAGSASPAGIIPGGESNLIPFSFWGVGYHQSGWDLTFDLEVQQPDDTPVDWEAEKDDLRPDWLSESEWEALWPGVQSRLGTTWNEYLTLLGRNAERLGRRGQANYCVRSLVGLEVLAAQGQPTAAIAGEVRHAEGGYLLGGVTVNAVRQDGLAWGAAETHLVDGRFVIENLPAGTYDLFVDGYYFDPPVQVTVSDEHTDVTGLTLWANPVPPVAEIPSEPEPETPDRKPSLAVDGNGQAHLVWQRGEEIWHAVYAGGLFTATRPISGAVGSDPALTYGSALIGGSLPGLAAVWQHGSGNEAHLQYALGQEGSGGLYAWSQPLTLTHDNYGDIAPALTSPDGDTLLIVWLQQDWDTEDDRDLYSTAVDPTQLLGLVYRVSPSPKAAFLPPALPQDEHCISVLVRKGDSLPRWVPVVGGRYKFEVSGEGCGEMGCELGLSSALGIELELTERVTGSGSATLGAGWQTDPKLCRYVFNSASLGVNAGASAQIPLLMPPVSIPGLTAEIGGQISGNLSGSIGWERTSFPAWPNTGQVLLTAGGGVYGKVEFMGVIEGSLEGNASLSARYLPPADFEFAGWCLSANASAKAWFISYSWTKKWGPCPGLFLPVTDVLSLPFAPGQAMLVYRSSAAEGVPEEESLVIAVDPISGTGHIYEGTAVLSSTISTDFKQDGAAAVAHSSTGEVLLAWSKDAPDPDVQPGSSVMVSAYNGSAWNAPVEVQSADYFNRRPALVFDSSDTPLLLWASAPATVTTSSPITDVLEAIANTDIFFSQRLTGTWTAPAAVAALDGEDRGVRVASGPGGEAVAVWVNSLEGVTETLVTAFWDGSAWGVPITLPVTGTVDSLDVAYSGGAPLLVWSQDSDGDPQTLNDLSLRYAAWDGSAWGTPGQVNKRSTEAASSASAPLSGGRAARFGPYPPEGWYHPQPAAQLQQTVMRGPSLRRPVLHRMGKSAALRPGISPPAGCCWTPTPSPTMMPTPTLTPTPPPDATATPMPTPGPSPTPAPTSAYVQPCDPNEKIAPAGEGAQHEVEAGDTLWYSVYFENKAEASAPAQEVVVVDWLDPDLDWDSFRFESAAFGDWIIPAGDNPYEFYALQSIPDYRDGVETTWWVEVVGQINPVTGRVQWTFRTLDPETGDLPEDALAGFLPPNDESGRGEGHVTFSIRPKADAAPGTRLTNQATIVFDSAGAITTNETSNTISGGGSGFSIYLPLVAR